MTCRVERNIGIAQVIQAPDRAAANGNTYIFNYKQISFDAVSYVFEDKTVANARLLSVWGLNGLLAQSECCTRLLFAAGYFADTLW
jgi:hypothetical protein